MGNCLPVSMQDEAAQVEAKGMIMLEALQSQEKKIKESLEDAESRLATAQKCHMDAAAMGALKSRVAYIRKQHCEMTVRICQVQTTIEAAQAAQAKSNFNKSYKDLTSNFKVNLEHWKKHEHHHHQQSAHRKPLLMHRGEHYQHHNYPRHVSRDPGTRVIINAQAEQRYKEVMQKPSPLSQAIESAKDKTPAKSAPAPPLSPRQQQQQEINH